ncbi:MAG TPA: hypothetical protein VFS21_17440 [Roseiflexaceae bacterium]|nr:hypothetical protein [Roseiflexaceae bacterium]
MVSITLRGMVAGLLGGALLIGGGSLLHAAPTAPTSPSTTPTAIYRTNLIRNSGGDDSTGSADGSVVAVPSWTVLLGQFTVVRYGSGKTFPAVFGTSSAEHGSNFFAGGNGFDTAEAYQEINVSAAAADIDAGRVRYTLSGYFGGSLGQQDSAYAYLSFKDATSALGLSPNLGGVSAEERGGQSALLPRSRSGAVPPGTRAIQVYLVMQRRSGGYNDGYADSLSLTLSVPTTVYLPAVQR